MTKNIIVFFSRLFTTSNAIVGFKQKNKNSQINPTFLKVLFKLYKERN